MECGLMNCIREGKGEGLISSQKIENASEFKITEGMLVQQAVGNPEDIYENIKTGRKNPNCVLRNYTEFCVITQNFV